ncbi:MAG: SGNH/GDSL hydrolase family protein [Candidatus Omnitrophota bacterium]|nr:SGNH/GDSL hydrolase family protein [Candidatus Omnitrophota bacterium]MBU1928874.1 SGNH/GDSL hydrolase family protein [Candidatus Omnitrophota bacterium]MBU2034484.1 SGNH/GDSL hydrolase family protein [Candidatus Omnitrophota bacterium]MBU2221496.1 SGNH/GDSL hydrolase family protein [Candidatus Omnitrophota bacterium]
MKTLFFIIFLILLNPAFIFKFVIDKVAIYSHLSYFAYYVFLLFLYYGLMFYVILSLVKNYREIVRYFKANYRNYLLLLAAVILSISAAEAILRVRNILSRTKPSYVVGHEFKFTSTKNSLGFRDEEFTKIKPKGVYRVFLIGDSFVEGVVSAEDTLDRMLEKKFGQDGLNWEVYNLGISGSGPSGYFLVAQEFRNYQPDLIIVSIVVDNDIERTREPGSRSSPEILNRLEGFLYRLQGNSLLAKTIKDFFRSLDTKVGIVMSDSGIDKSYAKLLFDNKISPFTFKRANFGDNQLYYDQIVKCFYNDGAFREHILLIKHLYKDVPFLLLINPDRIQVNTRYLEVLKKIGFVFNGDKPVDRKIQDAIISWAKENSIECLDILPLMLTTANEGFFYPLDGHYTAQGNSFVVDSIYDKIKQSVFLKK